MFLNSVPVREKFISSPPPVPGTVVAVGETVGLPVTLGVVVEPVPVGVGVLVFTDTFIPSLSNNQNQAAAPMIIIKIIIKNAFINGVY